MNKNNKGFTLIELLAAIVILGIMVFYAAPKITNMLDTNKNKIYITDAKKLIAQTEKKLKASSSVMEKPAEGHCIVVTLVFLDDNDFDSPPNQGEYIKESSYVVVKNIGGGNLEYSASIVEKMKKGGYKGVKLTTNEDLNKKDAIKNIKNFKKEELFSIQKVAKSGEYINSLFGKSDYITGVDEVYNRPDMSDSYEKKSLVSPNIVSAFLSSASNKGYNSLDAVLSLKIVDLDSVKNDIKIYISEKSYEDALQYANGTPKQAIQYSEPFRKEINFANPNRYSGETSPVYTYDGSIILLYVVAIDESKNEDRKIIEYRLHTNLPPEIIKDESSLTKLPSDDKNMPTARLTLSATDDVDATKDLQVCFTENPNATTCDNYKSYSSYFGNSNTYDYKFNRDICNLSANDALVYLKVFVKDSFGQEVSETYSYELYRNKPPTIKNVVIKPIAEKFTADRGKNIDINMDVEDDISKTDDIKITLTDDINTLANFKYNKKEETKFTFGGDYDGGTRTLKIIAQDECGATTSYYQNGVEGIKYKIYNNSEPTINKVDIISADSACNNIDYGEVCENSNNKKAVVTLDITDDIDYMDNYRDVMVCVSTNKDYCTDKSHYVSYENYYNPFEVNMDTSDKPYDGKNRYLYVFAEDQLHAVASKTVSYPIYKNNAPKINDFKVESMPEPFLRKKSDSPEEETCDNPEDCEEVGDKPQAEADVEEEEVGSLHTRVFIDGIDDIDEFKKLRYRITETNGTVVEGNLSSYKPGDGIEFNLKEPYNGTTRTVTLELIDEYGEISKAIKEYKVYKNEKPEIKEFSLESYAGECISNTNCVEGNYYIAKVNLDVYDDLDTNNSYDYNCSAYDKLDVCIDTCNNYDQENDICRDDCPHFDPETETCCKNWDSTSGDCKDTIVCVENDQGKQVEEKDLNTPDSPIKVCVSEDKNYCNPNDLSRFKSYSEYTNSCDVSGRIYDFSNGNSQPYHGEKKVLYVTVIDSLGEVATAATDEYILYDNKAPVIDNSASKIKSEENSFGANSSKAIYNISASDDITPQDQLLVKNCYYQGNSSAEVCFGDYVPYQESYNIDFGITDYQGQEFHVFSYVKDSYGLISKSASVDYKLYKDEKPTITGVTAAYKIPGEPNDKVGFSINVNNPFDAYQICINKANNASTCTFDGNYDGTTETIVKAYITDTNVANSKKYYVFAKDSHGQVSDSVEVEAQEYTQCGSIDFNPSKYEFTLSGTKEISHQECGGKCYYYNPNTMSIDKDLFPDIEDTSSTTATYKKKSFSLDSFVNSNSCLLEEEDYEAHCDFYKCFQTGVDASTGKELYNGIVIGLLVNELPEGETVIYKDGNTTYVDSKYYMVYSVSRDPKGGENIVYNPTNNKYPKNYVDKLKYNSSSNTPYIRILDLNI